MHDWIRIHWTAGPHFTSELQHVAVRCHYCFLSERSSFRTSSRKPPYILHSINVASSIRYPLIVLAFDATWSELLTVLLNRPQIKQEAHQWYDTGLRNSSYPETVNCQSKCMVFSLRDTMCMVFSLRDTMCMVFSLRDTTCMVFSLRDTMCMKV